MKNIFIIDGKHKKLVMKHRHRKKTSTLRTIWSLSLSKNRAGMALVIFLQCLYVPLSLLQPYPLKILADNVVGSKSLPSFFESFKPTNLSDQTYALYVLIFITIFLGILTQLHNVLAWMTATQTQERANFSLRLKLFQHVQSLPIQQLEKNGSNDSLFRISKDAESAGSLTVGLTHYLVSFLSLIGFGIVMFNMSPFMTFLVFAPTPLALIIILRMRKKIRSTWKSTLESANNAFNVVSESLLLFRLIRSFGGSRKREDVFLQYSSLSISGTVKATRYEASLDAMLGVLFVISQSLLLFYGVKSIQNETLSLGSLLILQSYSIQIYAPLSALSRMFGEIQQYLAMADRALSLLKVPTGRTRESTTTRLKDNAGKLRFNNVFFSYSSSTKQDLLNGLNIEIPPGTLIGIVGQSGSGKSTFLDLAAGLANPSKGFVHIDGIDLRNLSEENLHQQFAIVPQEPLLFSASIRENIIYGRQDATDLEIYNALEMAQAIELVESQPNGIDTVVGSSGATLSGGERQRICLARAFLKDAKILILDEPTSSLDRKNEQLILQAIIDYHETHRNRTILLVTHNEEYLPHCDMKIQFPILNSSS